jgi:phage terminase small subunit
VALTAKQSLFIKEYLVDLNATQAAIRAGYSEKTAQVIGSENLSKPIIAEAIALGSKERAKKVNISAEYVLQTIKNTIERCAQAEPVFDRDGVATGEYQFDSGAVLKGSELLGKYFKLFTDKIDHSSKDGTMSPKGATLDDFYNVQIKPGA